MRMRKGYLITLLFLLPAARLSAQQYGLFNTRTLFDAFENPSQKAFVLDSSRQFASNFFLPYFNVNAADKGDSRYVLSKLIRDHYYDSADIPAGNNSRNKVYQSANIYLMTFRLFQSYKDHKELGFSWQIRTDAFADYTNETLILFDDYNRFTKSQQALFNDRGYVQSYHQFSVTYRENYSKRLAFGAKLSLLSGITYNKLDVTQSSVSIDQQANSLDVGLKGEYYSSFLRPSELSKRTFLPDFKNPGLSLGFGTTYTAKSGIVLIGSVKDLGLIRWNGKSHYITVNDHVTVSRSTGNTTSNTAETNDLEEKLEDLFVSKDSRKSFYTLTNAKADFLISSRKFGRYTPNFIVSKNLFYRGGDVVFVNTLKAADFSLSLSPAWNMNGFGMLGTQGMYQTPNFEFFLGTDNLLRSAAIHKVAEANSGYTGASVYMGLAIKFGYVVEHPQNSSYMPGVGSDADKGGSFFGRLFSVFHKKH